MPQESKGGLGVKLTALILVSTIFPVLIMAALWWLSLITSLMTIFVIGLVCAVLIAVAISFIFNLQILRPIHEMNQSARVLSQGNLDHKIDIRTGDEIETLANSFNKMAEKLKADFGQLNQDRDIISAERNQLNIIMSSIVDGVIAVDMSRNIVMANKATLEITGYSLDEMKNQPISNIIKLFRGTEEIPCQTYTPINLTGSQNGIYHSQDKLKLVGKNGKSTDIYLTSAPIPEGMQMNLGAVLVIHDISREHSLEKMMMDFVSMASHELRTPLTAIIDYLSVFLEENKQKLDADQTQFLNKVFVSAKQLASLVENLLNVSRIERGRLSISPQSIDWSKQVEKAVTDLQHQAQLKNIILNFTPNQLPAVKADPLVINEVLNNLISNALNYTKEGGKVQVYTQVQDNEVVTTVEDTGVGIPPEAIPNLFTKFFRVNAQWENSKGTGLGLYISKSIIDTHGGKIWVESVVGKGSKFHFSLPIAGSSQDKLGQFSSKGFGQSSNLQPVI